MTRFAYQEGVLKIETISETDLEALDEKGIREQIESTQRAPVERTPRGFYRINADTAYYYISFKPSEQVGYCEICSSRKIAILFPKEICHDCKATEYVRQMYIDYLESEVGIPSFEINIDLEPYFCGEKVEWGTHVDNLIKIEEIARRMKLQSVVTLLRTAAAINPVTPQISGWLGMLLYVAMIRLHGPKISDLIYQRGINAMMETVQELSQPLPEISDELIPN